MIGQTDEWTTDGGSFSPFYRTLSPIGAAALLASLLSVLYFPRYRSFSVMNVVLFVTFLLSVYLSYVVKTVMRGREVRRVRRLYPTLAEMVREYFGVNIDFYTSSYFHRDKICKHNLI